MTLDTLNDAQRQAVMQVDGPILVLAGPGSGKTRVLTHRVAYLINDVHIRPYNILAVTFTNKAAREMIERLNVLIGAEHVRDLAVGTFHALCARILRVDGEHVGLARDFVIFDDDDQDRLVKQILKELDLDDKRYRPGAVLGAISRAKNEMVEPEDYVPPTYWHEAIRRIYPRYQNELQKNNAVDFDDLLNLVVKLFSGQPAVLEKYHRRWVYLHVDEFQDTNLAQYTLVKLLAQKHRNLFCVGDEDQCLPTGTKIQTPHGAKRVEELRVGDVLTVGAGRGETMPLPIERIHAQEYRGRVVKIRTRRGHVLRATPNHMLFARLGVATDIYYVYLMYRADRGYRIGLVKGSRSDGIHELPFTGLAIRARQENADKVWILRVCHSKREAAFYEQHFAFQYGIPTTLFHARGRGIQLSEKQIAELYNSLDTRARAALLMSDRGLFADYPHHRPKAVIRGSIANRKLINFRLFGDTRRSESSPWTAHRVSLNTTDRRLEKEVQTSGYHTRPGRRNTWRVEISNLDYDKAESFLQRLAEEHKDLEIASAAFLTSTKSDKGITRSFDFQPASHIHPTMIVPVFENGMIVEDEVIEVQFEEYVGQVYDINIPKVRNYVANGIVVHNSIYGWRGADYRNVLRLREDFPDARVMLLEQNYRSTQTILDAAQAVIRRNRTRHAKNLWTENERGTPVVIQEAYDEKEEAQFVGDEIRKLMRRGLNAGDFAIFYRTNAQSRALEEEFVRKGMKYKIVGATRFYQRREVKDLIAYLRLIHNPNDSFSLNRILNVPARGIGKTTQEEVFARAQKLHTTPYALLKTLGEPDDAEGKNQRAAGTFDARSKKALLNFVKLVEELRAARVNTPLTTLFDSLVQRIGFEEYLRDGTDEGEERWANVLQLRVAASEFADPPPETALPAFLERVALVSDVDELEDKGSVSVMMTLHMAKGLEFPVVFIVGMEEGILPHARSLEDDKAMEEERRLCYVGITRAKERVYLVYAFRRSRYGGFSEPNQPSRFLADVPREIVQGTAKDKPTISTRRTYEWEPEKVGANDDSPAREPQFRAGDKVKHALFGEGIVIESKIKGEDEEIQVAFAGKGVKKLLASVAKLKKK